MYRTAVFIRTYVFAVLESLRVIVSLGTQCHGPRVDLVRRFLYSEGFVAEVQLCMSIKGPHEHHQVYVDINFPCTAMLG